MAYGWTHQVTEYGSLSILAYAWIPSLSTPSDGMSKWFNHGLPLTYFTYLLVIDQPVEWDVDKLIARMHISGDNLLTTNVLMY